MASRLRTLGQKRLDDERSMDEESDFEVRDNSNEGYGGSQSEDDYDDGFGVSHRRDIGKTESSRSSKSKDDRGRKTVLKKSSKKQKKVAKVAREEDRRYDVYIRKVLNEIHPGHQISEQTVSLLNTCVYDVQERICEQAAQILDRCQRKTMTSSDIMCAVSLIFPDEMAKHARTEGTMALARAQGQTIE